MRFPMESSRQDYETFEANGVTSQSYISAVDDFAKVLIRGAAILGIARLVELLRHWIEERAVHYRTSAVLNGLYVNERLAPLPDIRIEPLPRSTDGAFGSLQVFRGSSIEDYLGRTVLNIDSIARPAFFRPDDEGNGSVVQSEFVSGVRTDTVCQALGVGIRGQYRGRGGFRVEQLRRSVAIPESTEPKHSQQASGRSGSARDRSLLANKSHFRDAVGFH